MCERREYSDFGIPIYVRYRFYFLKVSVDVEKELNYGEKDWVRLTSAKYVGINVGEDGLLRVGELCFCLGDLNARSYCWK